MPRMSSIFTRYPGNPHAHEAQKDSHFFSQSPTQVQKRDEMPFFQPQLTVGKPGDKYEQEADAVADAVVNSPAQGPAIQEKSISSIQRVPLSTPMEDEKLSTADQRMEKDRYIQEKPNVQMMEGEEEELAQAMHEEEENPEAQMQAEEEEEPALQSMEEEEETLQQKAGDSNASNASSHLSQKVQSSAGKGKALPPKTQNRMEQAFGRSFSDINVHTDDSAVQMNKELSAQAFTHGNDIYFNSGKFNPDSHAGEHLLAHELTHVVQQGKR